MEDKTKKILLFIFINVVLMVIYSIFLNPSTTSKIIKLSIWSVFVVLVSYLMTTYNDLGYIYCLSSSEIFCIIGLMFI